MCTGTTISILPSLFFGYQGFGEVWFLRECTRHARIHIGHHVQLVWLTLDMLLPMLGRRWPHLCIVYNMYIQLGYQESEFE